MEGEDNDNQVELSFDMNNHLCLDDEETHEVMEGEINDLNHQLYSHDEYHVHGTKDTVEWETTDIEVEEALERNINEGESTTFTSTPFLVIFFFEFRIDKFIGIFLPTL